MSAHDLSAGPIPQTARVRVLAPCTCSACMAPNARWWHCPTTGARFIVEYACTPVVEVVDAGIAYTVDHLPSDDAIAAIRAAHPTATLIY